MNRDTLQRILDTLIRASSYYDTYDAIAELEAELAKPEPIRCEQKLFMDEQAFYESPARRQPLTDEEITALLGPFPKYSSEWDDSDFYRLTRAIEALHGIKEQP